MASLLVSAACVGPEEPTVAPTATPSAPTSIRSVVEDPSPLQFSDSPRAGLRGNASPAALRTAEVEPESAQPVERGAPSSIGIVDIDRDGAPDLVFDAGRKLSAFRGGDGTFVDFTAAWLPPLVGVDQVRPFANPGQAPCLAVLLHGVLHVFAAGSGQDYVDLSDLRLPSEHRAGHRWIEPVDLDDDGEIDLVAAGPDGLRIFAGEGEVRFVDRTAEWTRTSIAAVRRVVTLDVDRDGELDLLLCGATLRLLRNDGSGRLTDETNPRLPGTFANPASVVAIDLDRDRTAELVVIGRRGELAIWRDTGVGQFLVADDLRIVDWRADTIHDAAVADLDGDGRDDLVCAGLHGLTLWINDGRHWLRPESWRLPEGWNEPVRQIRAVDLDQDGEVDLVVGVAGGLALLENDGVGHFVDATARRFPPMPR